MLYTKRGPETVVGVHAFRGEQHPRPFAGVFAAPSLHQQRDHRQRGVGVDHGGFQIDTFHDAVVFLAVEKNVAANLVEQSDAGVFVRRFQRQAVLVDVALQSFALPHASVERAQMRNKHVVRQQVGQIMRQQRGETCGQEVFVDGGAGVFVRVGGIEAVEDVGQVVVLRVARRDKIGDAGLEIGGGLKPGGMMQQSLACK